MMLMAIFKLNNRNRAEHSHGWSEELKTIYNEISMVMMWFGSGGDPESSMKWLNLLRWWK